MTSTEAPSADEVAALLQRLTVESTGDACTAAAVEVANLVLKHGITTLGAHSLLSKVAAAASDASATPIAREGAMRTCAALAEIVGIAAEPYLVPLLPFILDRIGDKVRC